MFSVFFTDRDVADYEDARAQDSGAYAAFFHGMLAAGVYLPPSAFEAWFVSTALGPDELARIDEALPLAARAAARYRAGDR
jgi:glutamate-1-semialdehyde 2,1-aminomutase